MVHFLEHLGVGGLEVEVFAEVHHGLFAAEVAVELPQAGHQDVGLLFEHVALSLHHTIDNVVIIENTHLAFRRVNENGKVEVKVMSDNPSDHTIGPLLLSDTEFTFIPRLSNKIYLYFIFVLNLLNTGTVLDFKDLFG